MDYRNNTNKRGNSPGKRGNTQVNAYEYSGKNFANQFDPTRQSQSTDFDFKKKHTRHMAMPSGDFTQQKVDNVIENFKNRDSQGSSSSNKMQKIQLSINKNEEGAGGSISHKSNNSFRLAENLFEIDQNQLNQNSFVNGQFKYQAKPPSPKKTDRFEKNGPSLPPRVEHHDSMNMVSQESMPGNKSMKQIPRVKKYTRQEIENRPGKYDQDNFYILPGGDFFDPQGYYFDKKGYDQLGGYYDTVSGQYIPGQEYAHLTMQKNQSYHAGDNRSSNKKNRFGGFDYGMQEDNTQLRRNYGSFHAHQNNQSFHGQQYTNFFPQKGGWNTKTNGNCYQNNTQQDFYRRVTTNGVDSVNTPAKDKKHEDNYDQLSAHSKNSFQRDSNFKSNKKPFKPTYDKTNTDDKPVEKGDEKKANQEEQDEMLVTKL